MFAGDDGPLMSTKDSQTRQKKSFSNTQPISYHGGLAGDAPNKLMGNSQQPGSRRELPNEKGNMIQGNSNQANRPGTAPTQHALMSSNSTSQQKQGRPMSPFTKVYNNQLQGSSGQGLR